MPHYFFRIKKEDVQCYFSKEKISIFDEEIMRHLFFFERLMRRLIFFWRNNEAPDFFNCRNNIIRVIEVTSQLALLFFQTKMKHLIVYSEKNQALHYLFRKMQHLIIPSEKIRCLIISSEKNELFFWRNNQACVFFLKK